MAECKSTDWRQLCAAAAREQDAAKLSNLVNQLIVALDQTLAPSAEPCVSANDSHSCLAE
jgi:hypothetical protein